MKRLLSWDPWSQKNLIKILIEQVLGHWTPDKLGRVEDKSTEIHSLEILPSASGTYLEELCNSSVIL